MNATLSRYCSLTSLVLLFCSNPTVLGVLLVNLSHMPIQNPSSSVMLSQKQFSYDCNISHFTRSPSSNRHNIMQQSRPPINPTLQTTPFISAFMSHPDTQNSRGRRDRSVSQSSDYSYASAHFPPLFINALCIQRALFRCSTPSFA